MDIRNMESSYTPVTYNMHKKDSKLEGNDFSPTYLNLWKSDYENDFLIGQCNEDGCAIIKKSRCSLFINGPSKCGKKHLAYKFREYYKIILLNNLSDSKIIQLYDSSFHNITMKPILWINGECNHSNDVLSRMQALPMLNLYELTQDIFAILIKRRILRLGYHVDDSLVENIISFIPRTFAQIDSLVSFVKKNNKCNMTTIKSFIDHAGS